MNKISIIIMSLFVMSLFSCKENAANKISDKVSDTVKEEVRTAEDKLPILTFVSNEFDFGTIDQGEVVTATFEYENTGGGDLIITKAKASCGCTVPKWPKGEVIKPGQKGTITAEFDSKTKTNKQNKSITLTTNTAKMTHKLFVKGFVTPDPSKIKPSKKNKKAIKSGTSLRK